MAATPHGAADSRAPHTLQEAVLKARFLDDKREQGRALGRVPGPAAAAALAQLLEDDNYWNRLAAVDGLLVRDDVESDRLLVGRLLEDPMVARDIREGLKGRASKHPRVLRDAYRNTADDAGRAALLDLLGSCPDADSLALLESIVERAAHPDRVAAMQAIIDGNNPAARPFILKHLEDAGLRSLVLGYLLRGGSAEDLPLFLKVLDGQEPVANALVAYTAVARWGDAVTAERVLVQALGSTDELRARGALAALGALRTERLVTPLCRTVHHARESATRIAASQLLAQQSSKKAVPCLVSVLRERYQATAVQPLDALPALATLGLSTLLQGLSERWNEDQFRQWRGSILQALRALTGTDQGDSYARWQEWAVHQGYTVDGVNILQRLFSPRPAERQAAAQAAARLLGHASVPAFQKKANLPASADAAEVTLALTRALMQQGFLVDDEDAPASPSTP